MIKINENTTTKIDYPNYRGKQAQWDIETLQKTIGVIPYEEMERDALERAIEALEKQVPQKIKKYKGLNETACPNCGFAFGYYEYDDEKFYYCYNCGQRLSWESEVEHDAVL